MEEFEDHQQQKGRQKSKAAAQAWQRRADALDARLAELENTPKVEATREVVDTGRTYADLWESADNPARNRILISAGARLEARPGRSAGWRCLDESCLDFKVTGGELDGVLEELRSISVDHTSPAGV